ncbi:MAG TPA: PKD domain-containing protein [Verrucomicrobiae bacterium]|nr:PKD domain-containing protein [Verrucomicrobiae bacterium]
MASCALNVAADCTVTNLGIRPLPDLGLDLYKNSVSGLYPGVRNNPPRDHLAAGVQIATDQIRPLDALGNSDTNNGKIVLLSIGMSNTTQEWGNGFMPRANADPSKNPQLVIVDGAQGGMPATDWTNYNAMTWSTVQTRLQAQGVSSNQVQVIWMKQARANPTEVFPLHARYLQTNLEAILRVAQQRYPNLKIAYLSSRTRSYATNAGGLNPEPFAYESAFSVRWLIEKQLNGGLNYTPANGAVVVPWMAWGPYLWVDGMNPRSDGFTWLCSDLQGDYTHPSPTTGVAKVGAQLLAFFKTDPTARPWFLKKSVVGQPPVCAPSAGTTNRFVPLQVMFKANASDPDGSVREYQWTFDDGTFATNANPNKVFFAPGLYQARLTVMDNNGNTATGSVTIVAEFPRQLSGLSYSNGVFECVVGAPTSGNHAVLASTNLNTWTALVTNRVPFVFRDTQAVNFSERFYQVLPRP